MGMAFGIVSAPVDSAPKSVCKLVVRQHSSLAEVSEFMISGLEIGQQVVAMAGPASLKELGGVLSGAGLRTETLIRNGRLVFLTAPDCISQMDPRNSRIQRTSLRLNGSVLRWVSDWSWAFGDGQQPQPALFALQQRVHEFTRSLTHLAMCTVHGQGLARASLLAMMADHRRAARRTTPGTGTGARAPRPSPVPLY